MISTPEISDMPPINPSLYTTNYTTETTCLNPMLHWKIEMLGNTFYKYIHKIESTRDVIVA